MAQIRTTGNGKIDMATSEIAIALHRTLPGKGDQVCYDEAMRLRDEIMAGTRELDAPAEPEMPRMTVWISPSGTVHVNPGCTGSGPRSRMSKGSMTRPEVYGPGVRRCRCFRWWPDRVREDAMWGNGYRIGKEDFTRSEPERNRATAGAAHAALPDEWWDGYGWGYDDARFLKEFRG